MKEINYRQKYSEMNQKEREKERRLLEGKIGYFGWDALANLFVEDPLWKAKHTISQGYQNRLEILTELTETSEQK